MISARSIISHIGKVISFTGPIVYYLVMFNLLYVCSMGEMVTP